MKKGFTILELLVVISVLVILIGIAMPRFKGMQDTARVAQAKAELKTMQAAVESYYTNANPHAYPATSAQVITDSLASANPAIVTTSLADPFSSSASQYNYARSSNGLYYVIWSVGLSNTSCSVATTGVVTKGSGAYCVTNGSGC